jgi:protein gp37
MSKSNIEWTTETWNPVVGCSLKSPGCTNCYAMAMAARIEAINAQAIADGKIPTAMQYQGTTKKVNGHAVWTGKLALAEHVLLHPLKRKKPTTYFVNSMGDLFHEDCPDEWIDKVFAVMALCPQHTFQILTKRAERMRRYLAEIDNENTDLFERVADSGARMMEEGDNVHDMLLNMDWPLPNVWCGISAERQQEWDERKEYLRETPAAVHFASFEPLLSSIVEPRPISDFLQWAIVGGESGPGARTFQIEWAREIVEQSREAGVPCFVKQIGAKPTLNGKPYGLQLSKKGGEPEEWPAYLAVREMPQVKR